MKLQSDMDGSECSYMAEKCVGPRSLFPSGFPTEIFQAFLIFFMSTKSEAPCNIS
jgi:hypothetical protein